MDTRGVSDPLSSQVTTAVSKRKEGRSRPGRSPSRRSLHPSGPQARQGPPRLAVDNLLGDIDIRERSVVAGAEDRHGAERVAWLQLRPRAPDPFRPPLSPESCSTTVLAERPSGLNPSTQLDSFDAGSYTEPVTAKDLRRLLRSLGCVETRQRGSHVRIECGRCVTTVPVHAGEDIGPGLLRRIERDLEPCLGKGWFRKP